MIITIDGPAGSGKSTVARKLANKLGFIHLNSGALFRAVALKAEAQRIDLEDETAVAALAAATLFDFKVADGKTSILVDGKDLSDEVLSAEAGRLASRIAVLPKLREILLNVQREVAGRSTRGAEGSRGGGIVVEGRDAGTVVFPDADAKFYLDADLKVRAERRCAQLAAAAERTPTLEEVALEEVAKEIEARDLRDSTREIAPQYAAADAQHIDTSNLSVDEVVEQLTASLPKR